MATQKKVTVSSKNSVKGQDNKKTKATRYHLLVTERLLNEPDIKKCIASISNALIEQTKNSILIGQSLFGLNEGFNKHLANKNEKKKAFFSFVQVRFGLKERRVQEYIRVAKHKELSSLKVPISYLVEIARLQDAELKPFLKTFSSEKLLAMTFKEVQGLVRSHNPKKVTAFLKNVEPKQEVVKNNDDSKASSLSVEKKQGLILQTEDSTAEEQMTFAVANLRTSFLDIKMALEKSQSTSILGLDALLSEINSWIVERQLITKKGA